MKKLVFELEDFDWACMQSVQACAKQAQAKFDEWYRENIESAPLVQGWYPGTYPNGTWTSSEVIHNTSTHTARLIDIQEIKKECVKHIAKFDRQQNTYFCENCGVELYAEWKVKP